MKDKIKQCLLKRNYHAGTERVRMIAQCFNDLQPQPDNSTQELLMMFIKDSYASATGKPSKKTAIAMMRYVEADEVLQGRINNSDYKAILNHKPLPPSKELSHEG